MPTATLFNYSFQLTQPNPDAHVPPTIRKVVIVGGGSAGWMAAMMLADALLPKGIEIEVLESPIVGIIGVGEGSTPWLRGFFDKLGIEEAEWMPACHATYKCGITFDKWSTKPGFESYFHPFASMLDNLTMTQFVHNVNARVQGADVHAHPNRFFIAAKLAEQDMAPKPESNFPFDVWYGYHFDAVLLGQFLQKKALERGVKYRSCHVKEVKLGENGDIASVVIDSGETIGADFFVDCTGFASLLSQQALKTPFLSFSSNLFNDAAVAMPTPLGDDIPSQTISTAMRHGWSWKIPLTERFGNGYVYSSSFCSAEEAERELREHLGLLDSDTPARHLKMKVGRVTKHWNRNCLAVGPVAGLHRAARGHGPALHPAHRVDVRRISRGRRHERTREGPDTTSASTSTSKARATTSSRISRPTIARIPTTGARMHRTETSRIRCRNCSAPGCRAEASSPMYPAETRQGLSGVLVVLHPERHGHLSRKPPDAAPTPKEARYKMTEIDNLLTRSALNFRKQKDVLARIPPKRREDALQIYFW
jgi:2-polyprenyl-6-methoxyphenol hydroxylase-like FAD-dependent oxidoreductase